MIASVAICWTRVHALALTAFNIYSWLLTYPQIAASLPPSCPVNCQPICLFVTVRNWRWAIFFIDDRPDFHQDELIIVRSVYKILIHALNYECYVTVLVERIMTRKDNCIFNDVHLKICHRKSAKNSHFELQSLINERIIIGKGFRQKIKISDWIMGSWRVVIWLFFWNSFL